LTAGAHGGSTGELDIFFALELFNYLFHCCGKVENWPLELEFAFSDILSTFSFLGLSISAKLYTTQPSSMACTSSGKLSQIGLVSSQSVVLDSLPGEPTAMPDVDNHCCQTGEDLEKPKTTNKLRKRKVHTVIEKNDCIE